MESTRVGKGLLFSTVVLKGKVYGYGKKWCRKVGKSEVYGKLWRSLGPARLGKSRVVKDSTEG